MTTAKGANPVRSMTGYAQAQAEHGSWLMRVSLRSVNHRFLDLRTRLSDGFELFEPPMRQVIRENVRRGHVDLTLHIESLGELAVHVNRGVAAAYLTAVEDLRREFGLSSGPDLIPLLRLPGVVSAAGYAGSSGGAGGFGLTEQEMEQLGQQVLECLREALQRLQQMREAEGKELVAEMRGLLRSIGEKSARLSELTEQSLPAYAQRLNARLGELLATAASVDPARLAQEAAFIAERADVSEELARLRSHLEQFGRLIDGAGELGKKLDFLLQEMQREANTFLSKTPGLGELALSMTELGLQIKADIEKLREQVQNVE